MPVILDARDRMTPMQLIVFESSGGPRLLVQGLPPQTAPGHGIVMDHRLASFLGYLPGDTITLFDYDFVLTGTSEETVSPFAPYVYLTYDGLLDMYFSQDKAVSPDAMIFLSALLVKLSPGVDSLPPAIFDKYEVLTPSQLGAADRLIGERMLGPALNLLVTIGFLITMLTLGLLMYAKALGRSREYGVQRALGVPAGWLTAQLALEGILVVVLALPLALLISAGIGELMLQVSPLYRLELLDIEVLLRAALVSILAGLAGSIMPLHRVAGTDPAIVFRGADV
jgi:ABC-type antimicrobial peptide transport system permease subunit